MKYLLLSFILIGCSGLSVKPPTNMGLSNSDIQKGAVTATIQKGAFVIESGAVVINNYFVFNTTMSVNVPNTKIQFMPKETVNTTYFEDFWKQLGFRFSKEK